MGYEELACGLEGHDYPKQQVVERAWNADHDTTYVVKSMCKVSGAHKETYCVSVD